MAGDPIRSGKPKQIAREQYESELKRIIAASVASGILLKVIGSLAFQMHCPKFGYLQQAMGRDYTDIDFAAYRRQTKEIKELMQGLGYEEQREIFLVSDGARSVFHNPENGLHVDIFYDKLDFCHVIPWQGRLEVDHPSIPLAEMLLEKMQIVEINEKDVIDTILLLLEHPLGDIDNETINLGYVARLCGSSWGLWRTTTMNLEKVRRLAQNYGQLTAEQKAEIESKVADTIARLEQEPKSLAWRVRARVGERVKWYKTVDEIQPGPG